MKPAAADESPAKPVPLQDAPPEAIGEAEEERSEPATKRPDGEDLETLNLLKFWWDRADDEERSAFLRWIEE